MSIYKPVRDGEAITLLYGQALKTKGARMNFSCCDCGLTHTIVIIPLKTRAKVYFWRRNRTTANIRRGKKFNNRKEKK